jgi:hypothetical protein
LILTIDISRAMDAMTSTEHFPEIETYFASIVAPIVRRSFRRSK